MIDLAPACTRLGALIATIADEQLDRPTPCTDASVGDLLDHVDGLAQAFAAAASKTPLDGSPRADRTQLAPDWRTTIPARLGDLAAAWSDAAAWSGMTAAGGVDLPGEVAGMVALDEVLVHGWDLARSLGRDFEMTDDEVATALGFVSQAAGDGQGVPGLFGPAVAQPDDAPPKAKLLGLTGRDPGWTP